MHPDGKFAAGCFFYGLGEHKPSAESSGIDNDRMIKNGAQNMPVKQRDHCPGAATSGTVVAGHIVKRASVWRKNPQQIAILPEKPKEEGQKNAYPANNIKAGV